MTLQSLTNGLVEYVEWLYHTRQWAPWELAVIGATGLLLLLLLMIRQRRRARRVAAGNAEDLRSSELGGQRQAGFSGNDGQKKRWSRTAKELRGFGTLVEQLQIEVSRYKVAEQDFKQQLARLKAANEQLQRELDARGIRRSELDNGVPLARFTDPQDRA